MPDLDQPEEVHMFRRRLARQDRSTSAAPVRSALIGVGLLLALLTGCAGAVSVGAPAGPEVITEWPSGLGFANDLNGQICELGEQPTEVRVPSDVRIVRATRCTYQVEVVPGDGEWSRRLEQEATAGVEALAAAVRLPDRERPGAMCAAVGYIPIIVTLIDDQGHSYRPAIPHEVCGAPLPEVTDALRAITWQTTASTRVRQVRTELEVSSGCYREAKPMIGLAAIDGSGTHRSAVDTTPRPLQLCRYDLNLDVPMGLSNGVTLHPGRLTSASTVDSATAGTLLAALDLAPRVVAKDCTATEAPFVVLQEPGDGRMLAAMEIGGCYRAWVTDDTLARQLDAATLAPLIG